MLKSFFKLMGILPYVFYFVSGCLVALSIVRFFAIQPMLLPVSEIIEWQDETVVDFVRYMAVGEWLIGWWILWLFTRLNLKWTDNRVQYFFYSIVAAFLSVVAWLLIGRLGIGISRTVIAYAGLGFIGLLGSIYPIGIVVHEKYIQWMDFLNRGDLAMRDESR